jgi:hypothetical protein
MLDSYIVGGCLLLGFFGIYIIGFGLMWSKKLIEKEK